MRLTRRFGRKVIDSQFFYDFGTCLEGNSIERLKYRFLVFYTLHECDTFHVQVQKGCEYSISLLLFFSNLSTSDLRRTPSFKALTTEEDAPRKTQEAANC